MVSTMIKAVVGLAVLASVSAQDIYMDGSSAARNLVAGNAFTFLYPNTFLYGAHGSGVGKIFVDYTRPINQTLVGANIETGVPYGTPTPFPVHGVLAFSDDAYPSTPPPPGIAQIPIAIGSIAFFVHLGVRVPKGVSLSAAQLCTIFSGKAGNWSDLNPKFPNIKVFPVRRLDASGSTDVVENYLSKVCLPKQERFTIPAADNVKILGAGSTSNMILTIGLTNGTIGYAVCGSFDPNGYAVEIPVQSNSSPPTPVMCQTADYSGFTIDAPTLPARKAWYKVSLTAGTKPNQYPTTNILYALARKVVAQPLPNDNAAAAVLGKKILLGLTTTRFQRNLAGYFYHALPRKTLTTVTCPAINALVTSPPIAPVPCPNIK